MNEATQSVLFSSKKQDWGTPRGFYGLLDGEFEFDVDVCAHAANAKSPVFYDESLDALGIPWSLGARWVRTKAGADYAKGEVCACTCHFRNMAMGHPGRSGADNLIASNAVKALCNDCSCKQLPGVGFMNPPYGDAENPCEKNCTKKKCKGNGHKPDCPADCQDAKCVGRGHCASVYVPGIADWMRYAYMESLVGFTTVCLVPSRVDTAWWDNTVHGKADEIRHIVGRLTFEDEFGNEDAAPFPTSVIVYRPPCDRLHSHVTTMGRGVVKPRTKRVKA